MLKPEQRVTPRDAFFAKSETVSASTAVGRISAELISAYPPGIPQVAPGILVRFVLVNATCVWVHSWHVKHMMLC